VGVELSSPYPKTQGELRQEVSKLMRGMDIKTEQLQRAMGSLTEEEKHKADRFLFYYKTISKANVSPIGINRITSCENEIITLGRGYDYDFTLEKIESQGIPELSTNNLPLMFLLSTELISMDANSFNKLVIKDLLQEQHTARFQEKHKNHTLLFGDTQFGNSEAKSYLRAVERYLKQKEIRERPSKEEIKRAQMELGARNILRYVDLDGIEIRLEKTSFEAWEEFLKENQELAKRLMKLSNVGQEQRNHNWQTQEFVTLIHKAFSLLRTKGFCGYPDLSA